VLCVGGPLHGEVHDTDGYAINAALPPDITVMPPEDIDPYSLISMDVITYTIRRAALYGQMIWLAVLGDPPTDEVLSALRTPAGRELILEPARRAAYGLPHAAAPQRDEIMAEAAPVRLQDYRKRMPQRACRDKCWYAQEGYFECEPGQCVHKGHH
jgi:hypothetical protein